MSDLIEHLESHLGRISSGWRDGDDGHPLPFQVALFEGGPVPGSRVMSTLGLSNRDLSLGTTGRRVRQELVLAFPSDFAYRNLPAVLQQVANSALQRDTAYLRGDVIGPRGPLIEGTRHEALYVAAPVYFPDTFHVFRQESREPVVFAWLVPITANEARFVRDKGWAAFEDELEKHDPDLLDFSRASMV